MPRNLKKKTKITIYPHMSGESIRDAVGRKLFHTSRTLCLGTRTWDFLVRWRKTTMLRKQISRYFCFNHLTSVSHWRVCLFQRCVVVQEVFPEGLVSQDGRLRPGDQLIEINGIDMTTASHHQVSWRLFTGPLQVENKPIDVIILSQIVNLQ